MNTNVRHEPVVSNFCGYDFVSIRVEGVDHYPISQLPFDSTGNQGFPVRVINVTFYPVARISLTYLDGCLYFNPPATDLIIAVDGGCYEESDELNTNYRIGDALSFNSIKDCLAFLYYNCSLDKKFQILIEELVSSDFSNTLRNANNLVYLGLKTKSNPFLEINETLKPIKKGKVYLVKLDTHLKLGFSANLKQRLASFKTSLLSVQLIKTWGGSLSDEYLIHRSLQTDKKRSERYPLSEQATILKFVNSYFSIKDTHEFFA